MEEQETGSSVILRRSKRAFGLCLSAVLVLAACSSKEHGFGAPAATGGVGESGGSSGGGAGGEGGLGAAGGVAGAGAGGGDPGDCETDDPHCACVDGDVVARDEDDDGAGSSLCAAAPGEDCNDSNGEFVQDACGGCNEDFVGLEEGDACGPGASAESNCGVVTCDGDVVSCETPPSLRRCADATTRELCEDAQWVPQPECDGSFSICHDGQCVECVPGTYQCDTHYFGSASSSSAYTTVFCGPTGSWESTHTSCSATEICTTSSGCTSLFHPRDADFEVVPLLAPQGGLGEGSGRPVRDVLDLAVGVDFG